MSDVFSKCVTLVFFYLNMSQRKTSPYKYTYGSHNNGIEIDITDGNPANDPRVVQYIREIKQLKQKVELQTQLNRQLERDKNKLESKLESYRNRCSDLQKNLDDKDAHLNSVVASLTKSHLNSKPVPLKYKRQKKKERSRTWFGFGSPRTHSVQQHTNVYNTPSTVDSTPSITRDITPPPPPLHYHHNPHEEDHENWGMYGTAISSLIGMEPSEMEFKIKSASKEKLRNYIRDLHEQYHTLDKEKCELFHDLVKATHNMGWQQKLAHNKDKECLVAKEKEKSAKNHIKSLEKSLAKERKKVSKYKVSFHEYKQSYVKKQKEILMNEKRLEHTIQMKDEFIHKACSKLIVYKDRLSQFEVPVLDEYLTLLSPSIQELLRCHSNEGGIHLDMHAQCTNDVIEEEHQIKQKKKKKAKHKLDLDMDLDELVSDSSNSSDSLLLSEETNHTTDEVHSIEEVEHEDGVQLKIVKYPGTGELYLVMGVTAKEIFRIDFVKCSNIEKNQTNTDFTIYFEDTALTFRGDNYEKVMAITIKLRLLLEQHSTNIEPELPPPPAQVVTDQMNIFFGGF
eukprot:75354_1